jgi:hypothetical protein
LEARHKSLASSYPLLSRTPRPCAKENQFPGIQSGDHTITVKITGRACAGWFVSVAKKNIHVTLINITVAVQVASYSKAGKTLIK